MSNSGIYFDGLTSNGRVSKVSAATDGSLCIEIDDKKLSFKEYSVSTPVGRSALRVRFRDGSLLELPHDSALLQSLSKRASGIHLFAGRFEKKFRRAASIVIVALAACTLFYIFGLPVVARLVTPLVPLSAKKEFNREALAALDRFFMSPSRLPSARQEQLSLIFSSLQGRAGLQVTPTLSYRRFGRGEKDMANAFALLPNTVVVSDALVEQLRDDEVKAVLAHELGHLKYDHGTQILVRSSLLSLTSLILFGGDPGLFYAMSISLVESSHSRDQEREADAYAVELLKKIGDDPLSLARGLNRMSQEHKESALEGYLSSHPVTSERVARIEELARR